MMSPGLMSTLAALAGTAIGGATTLLTSWLTHVAQTRAARLQAEKARREEVYGRFMDELSALYSHAFSDGGLDYARLVPVMSLRGRIMLIGTAPLVASANRAIAVILDLEKGVRPTPEQIRRAVEGGSVSAIADFAQSCRREFRELGLE